MSVSPRSTSDSLNTSRYRRRRLSSAKTVPSGNDGCTLSTIVLTNSGTSSLFSSVNTVCRFSSIVSSFVVVETTPTTSTGCKSATVVPAKNVTGSESTFTTRTGTSSSLSEQINVRDTWTPGIIVDGSVPH